MSRYVDAEYVKAVMLNDRLMQGNAEFTLYAQQVETQVNALPSIDIVRCGECKHWSGCKSTMHNNHLCGRAEKQNVDYWTRADDYCSYGEREGE